MDNNAAHNLLNVRLKSGWFVKEKLERDPVQSGSNFSVGYIVEKDGEHCFMKAFDFAGFLSCSPKRNRPDFSIMDVLNDMTSAFIYERNLSNHCRDKHVTKVSFVKESGEEIVTEYSIASVPYLIFELAKGDIRKTLHFSKELDYAWRFKSLHDIAVGLKQLHSIDVTHQDLKPSNILVFDSECRIGDLGRSICKNLIGPYNDKSFTGDYTYAPPEIWYNYYENDWKSRMFATDCYMLGSLIVFYFTGISMSALICKNIPYIFRFECWSGSFEEIIPYLENAFTNALSEFESNIITDFKDDLKLLVQYLCNPIPQKRGHPKSIVSIDSNYSMERFITKLDILKRKAELSIKRY
jgi:Protein kinase domain.